MKLLPSIIRWMFLFAALAGIVAIVFHVVRYRPRCTLQITAIDTVQLTPDGGRLLIYGVPGPATVWDARSGALIHELLEERGLVATLLPSQRGSLAAAIVDNNQVWLIDWSSGEHWRSAGPQDPVEVRFSDSGSLLLVSTGMDDPKTFVFDVATKRRMLVAAGVCKHISSDERRLFMRKWPSRALSVMDIETAETVADLPLTTQDVSFSANGKRLVAGLHAMSVGPLDDPVTSPAPLSIYELTGGEFKQTPLKFDRNPLRCGVMSADGGILITWLTNADFTTNLDFVDAAAGRALASHALLEGEVRRRLRAKAAGGSLSLDGSLFGFVGREGRDDVLMMFDARTGRLLWKRTGVSEAIFLPGGEVVAYRPWVLRLFDSHRRRASRLAPRHSYVANGKGNSLAEAESRWPPFPPAGHANAQPPAVLLGSVY